MQNNENAEEQLGEKNRLDAKTKSLKESEQRAEEVMRAKVATIGNIVHASVPTSKDEDNNSQIKTWHPEGPNASVQKRDDILSHHEVMHRLDILDQDRGMPPILPADRLTDGNGTGRSGTKVAGHRGFFLINDGVDLNQALITYGLDFLKKRNYKKVMTPFMMRRRMMAKTAQLSEFDEALYKLEGREGDEDEKYLIATSEQPLSAYHADEWFEKPDVQLPIR